MPHHLPTSSPTFPPPPAARYYHSTLSIWLSVDPMSDKYPSMSPYTYCGNTPVILRDPDGRDYEVVVDEDKKTITIRATYYTDVNSSETLQKGLDAWNKQSGIYSYQVGKRKNAEKYTICFDLSIAKDSDGNFLSAPLDIGESRGSKFNMFSISESVPEYARGVTEDGHICKVRPDAPIRTTIHEIGHTIGLGDFGGDNVMVSGGTSSRITSSNVVEILNHAGFVCFGTWSGGSPIKEKPTHSIIDYNFNGSGCVGKFK